MQVVGGCGFVLSLPAPSWVEAQLSIAELQKDDLVCHAVSRCCCAMRNGDFSISVSVCQLVLVCPAYDRKLSVGANDL